MQSCQVVIFSCQNIFSCQLSYIFTHQVLYIHVKLSYFHVKTFFHVKLYFYTSSLEYSVRLSYFHGKTLFSMSRSRTCFTYQERRHHLLISSFTVRKDSGTKSSAWTKWRQVIFIFLYTQRWRVFLRMCCLYSTSALFAWRRVVMVIKLNC